MFGRNKCKHQWHYIRATVLTNKRPNLEFGESFYITEVNKVCTVCQKKQTDDLKGYWTLSELNGEI